MQKINIPAAFGRIGETWSPHIAADVNGQEVRLAKIEGAFDWHSHPGVDELFFVVKGRFVMQFRDREVAMEQGDLLVVPAGAEHRPVADEECWIMLVEDAGTRNTGEAITARTRHVLPRL
jgi:mannose-6-phosphate isomerase-like protein (cupin superfamily)